MANQFEINSIEQLEFMTKYLLARQTGRESDLLDAMLGPGLLAGAWARALTNGMTPSPAPAPAPTTASQVTTASQATKGETG